ncbi:tellurite resistance TerB family protein [Lacibacter sediminis]|uniref:TerB family tellurite resistance protein n=1 Tax=Lacibacter sediminis TaxID=2760713 RepID=A0A7G5XFP8_9BACT|nr:TerB family tellurite resistance protein [Lacibacter sediminis]QNA44301.1 TerB family tellurite resistance protein [Lacibacter sediminis]
MDHITFDKLLLKTAFCCMASDGHIDKREVAIIESMCEKSPLFSDFNFHDEINLLVTKLNTDGKEFIKYYFDLLDKSSLTEEEEMNLIDFALHTINADEQVEYSEVKFFKNIRHRLKVSDDKILSVHPDIEIYLEEDLVTDSFLSKITLQYLEGTEFPKFELINTIQPGTKEE